MRVYTCVSRDTLSWLHLTRSYLVAAAFTRPARGGGWGGGGEEDFSKACEIAPLYGTRMERGGGGGGGRVSWGTQAPLGNTPTNVCQRSRIRIVYTVTTDGGAITSSGKFSFAPSIPRQEKSRGIVERCDFALV